MASYQGFINVDVVGVAGGQQIVNKLYYGNDVGESFLFNDAFMASFGAAWSATFLEDWLGEQTTRYTLSQLEVRAVDARGNVISENAAEIGINAAGDIDNAIPGAGLAAILSIKTTSVSSEESRSLKRSYLAWGPVPSVFITDPTGELTNTAKTAYATIAALIGTSLLISAIEYVPVRVGRTVAPATVAVGTIVSVTVKPFVQPRKSRFPRTDGT